MPLHNEKRLRVGRISEVGRVYLITTCTTNRTPCFQDWRIGRLVVRELMREQMEGNAFSFAWVLMPDHLHWLVELKCGNLSAMVRRVKSLSTRSLNAATHQSGGIWQKGFHDRALRREEDLRATARYVIANPLRAGLVERIGDYPLWDAAWI